MAIPARRWVGYALLIAGLLLLFDTETFLRTNWSPLALMSVPTESALAYFLVTAGIVTLLTPTLIRIVSGFAPDASVQIGPSLPHQSVEFRLQQRFPLKRKFSALPNRALVGGTTMLLLLIPAFLMMDQQHPPSRGIYVRALPQKFWGADENCLEGLILVTVAGNNEATRLLLNGKEISREELAPALKAALATRANWEVYVEGDDSVPYADPVYAIDVVTSLHARAVILTPTLKEQIAIAKCSLR